MSIIEDAGEQVTAAAPKVLGALVNIKFLLITIPIVCVLIGLATQTVTSERNVGILKFEMGSFATPDRPIQVPLAEAEQMKVRIRKYSHDLRNEYPKSIVFTTLIENDVITIRGTAKGKEQTKRYLSTLAQREIEFQNNRLENMKNAQIQRMEALQQNLKKYKQERNALESRFKKSSDPITILATQQGIDNASTRIAGIQKELDAYAVLNASDLFIDSTQVILGPLMVASSKWYRPLIAGAIGLGVGLLLTLLIAIIAVIISLSSGNKNSEESEEESD